MTRLRIRPRLDADVIVAGGGPAGAAAATHMARAGLEVLVLDREAFPRDKVCGDFVGPAALAELEALGLANHEGYTEGNVISHAALHVDGRRLICQPLPHHPSLPDHGRVIPRLALDGWILELARRAGATILERSPVTQYQVEDGGITVSTPDRAFRASLLIGADGSSSTVSRLLRGAQAGKDDRIIAIRAYFENISGPENQADLYFSAASFPGYYWLFPAGHGTANVGVGMLVRTLPRVKDHLRNLLLDLLKRDPALQGRLRDARLAGKIVGWPLSTYNPRLPLVADRVLLIGDAAGFINPLNGEGIQYALLSGRWASEAALECIASGSCGELSLQGYAARAERELALDMALASLVVQAIRNRHLTPVWFMALQTIIDRARHDPVYAQTMGGILAGVVPARDALKPKILTGTARQALQSLGFLALRSALSGPEYLTKQKRSAGTLAVAMASDPGALLGWLGGLASNVVALGVQSAFSFTGAGARVAAARTIPLQIAQDHVENDLL